MNRGDAWCLLLVLLIMPSLSLAQGAEEQLAEARAESLTGRNDDPEGALDAEHLGIQEQRRFRLNRMGKEELMADLDLSMAEADAMLAYRARLGAFIDPMELQAVPGWSLDLVRRLLPLVRLDTMVRLVPTLRERLDGGGQQLILRLGSVVERSKGYVADSIGRRVYAGGPMRATVQYRFRFRSSLDFGFRADKDAGERWLAPGGTPDHVSAFLAVRDLGTVSTLVVGDYEVCLAQGLVVWQGMAFRKGANSMEVMRSGPVFRPHSGAEENRYMRGAAVTLRRGRWNVHLFSGMNRLDAHRIFDSASGILEFTGFQTSGLHRTASEIRDRKSLVDIAFGGRASLSLGAFAIGFNLTGRVAGWASCKMCRMTNRRVFGLRFNQLVREGKLVRVLEAETAPGPPVHALCAPGRRATARVRAAFDAFADPFGAPFTAART